MEIITNIKKLERRNYKFFQICNTKLFQGFIATLLGSGTSKIVLVIATFVCSNMLGKMEFGELSFVRNTLNMILCICALNFSALCTKFTTEAKTSIVSLHRLFLLFAFSFTACIVTGLLLTFSSEEILLKLLSTTIVVKFFRIAGVLLPLFMLQPLIEGVLVGLKKFKLIGILQTLSSLFYLSVVSIGIVTGGLNGALIGVMLYYALYSVVSLLILYRKINIKNNISKLSGFWGEKRSMLTMIMPIFLMSFIDAPVMWIAQVILSKTGTMESIGSMTAMMQIRNLAMLIPGYFSNTYLAFAGELNSQKRYTDYYRQLRKILKIYLLVGLAMFFLFSVFSKQILFLYGSDFVEDWPVMIISNIGIPLIMLIGLFRMDLLLKDHQQYLLYISLAWNTVWLISLYVMITFNMNPLFSFFLSQTIGAIVFLTGLYIVYSRDKRTKLYEQ